MSEAPAYFTDFAHMPSLLSMGNTHAVTLKYDQFNGVATVHGYDLTSNSTDDKTGDVLGTVQLRKGCNPKQTAKLLIRDVQYMLANKYLTRDGNLMWGSDGKIISPSML